MQLILASQMSLNGITIYLSFFISFIIFIKSNIHWLNFSGFRRFALDIKSMLGFSPNIFWKTCWMVLTPVTILVSVIISPYAIYNVVPEIRNFYWPMELCADFKKAFLRKIQFELFTQSLGKGTFDWELVHSLHNQSTNLFKYQKSWIN